MKKLCDYGCGNEARYTLKNGKKCCSSFYTKCPHLREKNSKGLKKCYEEGRRITPSDYSDEVKYEMGKSHRGKIYNSSNDVLVENSKFTNDYVKKILFDEKLKDYKCDICGLEKWLEKDINLELHHINGNSSDHRSENLQLLCPNCHSQTDNFRGRNIKKVFITDEEFLKALSETPNIRQALIKLGLAPKGLNYIRAKKLLDNL